MKVQITVEAVPVLSYAMAHNRVPIVRKLVIENHGPDLEDAQVSIAILDDEGPISHDCLVAFDAPTGSSVILSDASVHLNPAAMHQVRDRRPARLEITVRADGAVVGRADLPVELLPGNHWLSIPYGLAYEMLPAFVLPNDPAIAALLTDAAAILEKGTGSPSMQGYQSGPDRVDEVVRAVWMAAQARTIRYAMPPASWADLGQKVRTPREVLEDGLGTCLDTTVVLAAALEQAGVRPLIWVTRDHAFLAYWREETALDAIAHMDVDEVLNYVDLGLMRLVETTAVTKQDDDVPFEATHRLALRRIQDPQEIAVIDVWRARAGNVLPLPVRRQADDGTVQVIHYQAAQHSGRELIVNAVRGADTETPTTELPQRVQQWKNSLLDLSLRNRLINYSDRAGVRLRVPEGRLGEIEDLVSAGKALTLRATDQIDAIDVGRGCRSAWDLPDERVADQLLDKFALYSDVGSGAYLTRMRNLAYKARTIQEETGANNLYLALGSLHWSLDGRPLRSPLILVPVRLVTSARGQLYRLQLDESGGSTPNYCLLEKLRQVHGLAIPKLAEPEQDLSGVDLDHALHETRLAIANKGLPFRVEATADLSILQFAKFRLWKDLDEHWRALMENSLVRHLVSTPTDPYEDPIEPPDGELDLDALDAQCPVPADASQLGAVAEAVVGRTFVLEGPPGTGKSQTITNLLTRAVAEGKRVLFVAEKRAALDVVSSRLDAVGMGPFSLDLHDKSSKPTVVRAQIRQALDHSIEVDRDGLAAQEEDLRSSRRTLARYAQRLHEKNAAGHSYYSARTQLLALGAQGPTLPVPPAVLGQPENLQSVRRQLTALPDVADPARPAPDHPWGFVRLTSVDSQLVTTILMATLETDRAVSALPIAGPLHDVLRAARTVEDLSTLAAFARAPMPLDVLDQARTDSWKASSAAFSREIAAFLAAAHPGLDVVTPAALDLPLSDIHAQAEATEASGFFGKGKRRKAIVARIEPALRPGATLRPKEALGLTTALLQVQGAVRGLAGRAGGIAGVHLPEAWNPFTEPGQHILHRQMEWLAWAGSAVDEGTSQREFTAALRAWLRSGQPIAAADASAVQGVADAFRHLSGLTGATPAQLRVWSSNVGLLGRWTATAARRTTADALPLRRWVALNASLAPLRSAGLSEAADLLATGEVDADDAVRAFERGIAQASLVERRQTTGLDAFDPVGHDRAVNRFINSVGDVRRQMATAVPAQVLAARPFQASTGRGQVGELQRELAKQRRGLGVRALMERYGDLITQVMPCVLVSPDSVARFFPVGSQTFDLVVFDEASQIRVADAIGAMGRANSVVVVGDSKQMPPTSFAEPSGPTDDDFEVMPENAVEDEESILTEAVLARVPQRWLTWHYRSQDESLIAFSNVHYYESKLSSFPAPTHPANRLENGHGVSLVRVNGQFLRKGAGKLLRTNPVEAEAIVAEIRRRFADSPEALPSLGVVTFNQQQRTHIEGLLRDTQDERLIEALDGTNGEGIFIKNLENVQGDERDVILFSTAFSVNDKGVLPLNFGPLTRAGGERRLNVAITRARRQVILYCSFDPSQLRVEQTQSVGIHHLRGYLELAAAGTAALAGPGRGNLLPDRHRDEVAEWLRQRGLVVQTDVGLSDFRVDLTLASASRPDEPVVAVLLDGPGWAARRTVGDRDGLPVEVLGRLMGWPAIERVWMPAWSAEPDAIINRLMSTVSDAAAGTRVHTTSSSRATPFQSSLASAGDLARVSPAASHGTAQPEPSSPRERAPLPGQRPFAAYEPKSAGGRHVLDDLPSIWAAQHVRRVIVEVVQQEGPIHLDRLARLVAACFDLTRLNQARVDSIVQQVPNEMRKTQRDAFAWAPDVDPKTWTEFRASSDTDQRPLEHISLREVGNAMVALCLASAGMTADELATETLAVFGWKRRTAGIAARLDIARETAVSEGRLKRSERGHYEVS